MAYREHAYLNTRITLLSGGIKHPDKLVELVTSSNSNIQNLLPTLGLPAQVAESINAPERLDRQLHKVLLQEVTLLLRAVNGALRQLIIHWLRQYEIMNIKAILRARAHGQHADIRKTELFDIGKFSLLSEETLRSTEDVNEIFRLMERYGYSGLAQKARLNYEQRQDVFELEAMIDRQYYVELIQHSRFLKRKQQKILQPLIGMMLDRINLIWLLRYRINFGMESSHAYYLLVPGGVWLDNLVLMEMLRHDNLSEVVQHVPLVWKQAVENTSSVDEIENQADQLLYNYYSKYFSQTSDGIARLVCYLFLRQQQLKKISIVFKGKQLGIDAETIISAAGLKIQ
ncbi:MAG: V-type ATPase subunit, partial [Thiohalophilus sp.]